jgi:SARP family transcriptional regulator, regulator of embCAB operon
VRSVHGRPCRNLAETLATRIQLCGKVTVELEGTRVERSLPGRQGRLLFVYLCVHRHRAAARDDLVEALWPQEPPAATDASLSALLSRLRRVVAPAQLEGRSTVQLRLPPDAWVDLEAAAEGLHRAESAAARGDWTGAWGPGRVAQHIASRDFLPGEEAPWVDAVRRQLDEILVRALEVVGTACIRIGGAELDTAERTARTLVERQPFRESGHRLLMQVLAARGNAAEALLVYDDLRRLLHDELGAAPSTPTQELHRRLLG